MGSIVKVVRMICFSVVEINCGQTLKKKIIELFPEEMSKKY